MEGKKLKKANGVEFQEETSAEEILIGEKLEEITCERKLERKTVEELSKDEEMLKSYLDKLKRENYELERSVKAWKMTLRNKLEELKEADLKLDEVHNEIQSEREDFCSKLDKFNDEYGLLSTWWQTQMNFLTQLENLEEKNSQEQKCKEEIKQLEEDIQEIKNQIQILQNDHQQITRVDVHSIPEEPSFRNDDDVEEVPMGRLVGKKVKMSNEDEIICEGEEKEVVENFFSLVDVEKVRKANRKKNKRNKFINNIKKILIN